MFNKILAVINNIHLTPKGKAHAILALEKNGRHWCKWYKDFCMYQLCSRHHDWLSCPDCRLVTIADLVEVK